MKSIKAIRISTPRDAYNGERITGALVVVSFTSATALVFQLYIIIVQLKPASCRPSGERFYLQ
ncbi:hypothetical protein M427DRAFT_333374 [Gonapodya prolifera JEL478]|uniref:Uncharacterized protein n=1 Tax=Gonapodya prolifera (strain JEL478) TaxID=1344416 RepID=A0A139AF05_GONPJ|nr:hypothetical protein M427DRAFT_333374 [Gonapodya prolifera JEL478]|eukprot:KXS15003.1 hypothetical protein M427DRAFT_333374 [Gonapodya prolifera JEL478]